MQPRTPAEPAPTHDAAVLNEHKQGHELQLTDQPDQGVQTTAEDGRHVMHDAMAEDGSGHMQGATDTADTHEHSSEHIATNHDGLHGGDAPMQTPLIDPVQLIKTGYTADPLYASSIAAGARRSKLGIIALGGLFRKGVAICVPDANGLQHSITRELHCSPYAGHTGMNRTLVLVSRYFYWPNMQHSINDYVRGCVMCQ